MCDCVQVNERISCFNCDSNSMSRKLEEIDHEVFYELEIANFSFPTKTIPAYWFTDKIILRALSIEDKVVTAIEPNAFKTFTFNKIWTLKLNMPLEILRNDTFNGLSMAFDLKLENMKLHSVETDVAARIQSLCVIESQFDGMIFTKLLACLPADAYSVQTEHLKTLNVIRKDLFSKFTAIITLILRSSGITHIEAGSFDTFAETLSVLSLGGNLLKTLSEHVFPHQYFFSDEHTIGKRITLISNPWDCLCQLEHLRRLMIEFPKFFYFKPVCATPIYLKGKLITETKLCDYQNDCLIKYSLLPSPFMLQSIELPNGSNNDRFLALNTTSGVHKMIWFEHRSLRDIQSIKCITLKPNMLTKIKLTEILKSNKIYTLCLMQNVSITINPFHCYTQHIRTSTHMDQTGWLLDSMKIPVVVGFIISCSTAVLIGAAVVIAVSRKLANWINKSDCANDRCMNARNNFYIHRHFRR